MPKTALYNMEGKADRRSGAQRRDFRRSRSTMRRCTLWCVPSWPTSARAPRAPSPAARSGAAAVRSTARRAPAARAITATARRSSPTAAWCSRPSPAITSSTYPKRSAALRSSRALTAKLQSAEIIVVDELKLNEAKTRMMVKFLSGFELNNTTLLVLPGRDETVMRACGQHPQAPDPVCQHPQRVRHPEGRQDHPHQGSPQRGRGGVRMKDPHDVIIRPVLTEESYEGIPEKRYAFVVDIGRQQDRDQAGPGDRSSRASRSKRSTSSARWARSSGRAAPRAARPRSRKPMSR